MLRTKYELCAKTPHFKFVEIERHDVTVSVLE